MLPCLGVPPEGRIPQGAPRVPHSASEACHGSASSEHGCSCIWHTGTVYMPRMRRHTASMEPQLGMRPCASWRHVLWTPIYLCPVASLYLCAKAACPHMLTDGSACMAYTLCLHATYSSRYRAFAEEVSRCACQGRSASPSSNYWHWHTGPSSFPIRATRP